MTYYNCFHIFMEVFYFFVRSWYILFSLLVIRPSTDVYWYLSSPLLNSFLPCWTVQLDFYLCLPNTFLNYIRMMQILWHQSQSAYTDITRLLCKKKKIANLFIWASLDFSWRDIKWLVFASSLNLALIQSHLDEWLILSFCVTNGVVSLSQPCINCFLTDDYLIYMEGVEHSVKFL